MLYILYNLNTCSYIYVIFLICKYTKYSSFGPGNRSYFRGSL